MNLTQKINIVLKCYKLILSIVIRDKNLIFRTALAVAAIVSAIILNLQIPILFKDIVNKISLPDGTFQVVVSLAGIYGLCWIAAQSIEQTREILLCKIFEKATVHALLDYYLELIWGGKEYNDQIIGKQTTVLNLFQEGFPILMWGINFFFIPIFIQTVAAGFILANYCGYRYGLIFLIITMLFYLITQWGVKRYLILQRKSFEASSLFSSFLINRLVNIESVFYYTNLGQEKKEASAYLKEIEEAETKAKSSMESLRIFQSICVGSGLMIVTILSAITVFTHAGNMGEFVMINAYILQFTVPLSSLGLVLSDIYRGFTCVEGLFNNINEKKNLQDSELKISFHDVEKIELVDVSYKYPNSSSPIIENLSLSIKATEKVGFFGDSGSGKTTIIKLLLKRINPTSGKILINDIPIGNFNTQELHQKITVVPQRVELFKGTLFYNLGFGNNQISEDEINEALSITSLSYLINRLPKGLHSELGEFGQMLSGGERQRIAIAMALLRQPQFLILDEALSFVDKKTANKILASLKKIPWLKGFILVSHDLNLLNSLDKIFFFNNGALQVVSDYEKFLKVESA